LFNCWACFKFNSITFEMLNAKMFQTANGEKNYQTTYGNHFFEW
jgi:hypothetical protein